MMQKHLLALLLLTLFALPSYAQRMRCGTVRADSTSSFVPSDCGYWTNSPQPEYEPGCTYDIQVVFHVIQRTSGLGYLSPAKIQDQIDILNEDFQAIAGSAGAAGTNAKVRFHLATTTPDGSPTNGITYTTNNSWYNDSGDYWSSLHWDTHRYMNVYTNAPPCCYGYVSGFASQGIAGQADDRIVLWWEAVGRDATSGWPLNMGRTGTHEVGHYVGLYHTFDSGCGSATDCYGTGDLICDTNRESQPTYGCPSSKTSCSSRDPIHNYMDYTDDPCLTNFTPEQVNRMRCTLIHWRPDVYAELSTDPGDNYCVALANSSGFPGYISAEGAASISANDLKLVATSCATNNFGIFFYGPDQVQIAFGDGNRCVGGSIYRLGPPALTDNFGRSERILDFTQPPLSFGSGMVLPGSTWNFQFWFRDPAGPGGSGFNLTDGRSIAFCP